MNFRSFVRKTVRYIAENQLFCPRLAVMGVTACSATAPRSMIVFNFCIATVFIMALHFIWIIPLNIIIHCGAAYVTKSDDQFFDAFRRYINKKHYYSVYFADPITKAIDDERKAWFTKGENYESSYYLSIYWLPPSDNMGKIKQAFIENHQEKVELWPIWP